MRQMISGVRAKGEPAKDSVKESAKDNAKDSSAS
jgi:preprotein translocase subunit YajC